MKHCGAVAVVLLLVLSVVSVLAEDDVEWDYEDNDENDVANIHAKFHVNGKVFHLETRRQDDTMLNEDGLYTDGQSTAVTIRNNVGTPMAVLYEGRTVSDWEPSENEEDIEDNSMEECENDELCDHLSGDHTAAISSLLTKLDGVFVDHERELHHTRSLLADWDEEQESEDESDEDTEEEEEDSKCQGVCMNVKTSECSTNYELGKCPGSNEIQCCVDEAAVKKCDGSCIDSKACSGTLETGICPGPAHIQCCKELRNPREEFPTLASLTAKPAIAHADATRVTPVNVDKFLPLHTTDRHFQVRSMIFNQPLWGFMPSFTHSASEVRTYVGITKNECKDTKSFANGKYLTEKCKIQYKLVLKRVMCNHGDCPGQGKMKPYCDLLGPVRYSKPKYFECKGPYAAICGSQGKGHNCNDDATFQLRLAQRTPPDEKPTGYDCHGHCRGRSPRCPRGARKTMKKMPSSITYRKYRE